MIPRQESLKSKLPRFKGSVVGDGARQINKLLDNYCYSNTELDIFEKEINQILKDRTDAQIRRSIKRKAKNEDKHSDR